MFSICDIDILQKHLSRIFLKSSNLATFSLAVLDPFKVILSRPLNWSRHVSRFHISDAHINRFSCSRPF